MHKPLHQKHQFNSQFTPQLKPFHKFQYLTYFSLFMLFSLAPFYSSSAFEPVPYKVEYDARFQGFKAKAEMKLIETAAQQFQLHFLVKVKLLGKTITTINESSLATLQGHTFQPLRYNYTQTGLGKNVNSIEFNWQDLKALTVVDKKSTELALPEHTVDVLSMYNKIKQAVARGENDIHFTVIDEGKIKQYHYKVLGEETLETPLGLLNTIKVSRIRAPDSKRVTELWLAKDWHFLLVKLYQKSSKGKESYMNIRKASSNKIPVTGLSD